MDEGIQGEEFMKCPQTGQPCDCDINSALTCPPNKSLKPVEKQYREGLTKGDIKINVGLNQGIQTTELGPERTK